MFVIIGFVVVVVSVLGGFILEGGHLLVLLQWAEFVIIGGVAAGALLISTPKPILSMIVSKAVGTVKTKLYTREDYLELLQLMYELFQTARVKGLLTLEPHVEKPEESELFSRYPIIMGNHHAMNYLADSLKLLVVGGVPALELELMMDADLETQAEEGSKPSGSLNKIGDSLPGMGIVAAVLGIIITMGSIGGPAAEVGHKVAAALVGTFLGILLCYGFIGPLATQIEYQIMYMERFLHCIKAGVVAYAKGMAPIVAVEFARRVIFNDARPSFAEVEDACRAIKVK